MAPKKKTTLQSLKAAERAMELGTSEIISRITPVQGLTREEMRDGEEEQQTIAMRDKLVLEEKEEEKLDEEVEMKDDGIAKDEEISDADYMARRMKRKLDFDEYVEEEVNDDLDIERADREEEELKKLSTSTVVTAKVWEKLELDPGEVSLASFSALCNALERKVRLMKRRSYLDRQLSPRMNRRVNPFEQILLMTQL